MTTSIPNLEAVAMLVAPHEDAIAQNPYNVKTWTVYLDAIDDWLLLDNDNKNSSKEKLEKKKNLYQLKDWVGRRAVQKLPRSLKLWKLHWEHVLQVYDSDSNNTKTKHIAPVMACFEQAVTTLSAFPRVWAVYLEFLFNALGLQADAAKDDASLEDGTKDDDDTNTAKVSVTFVRRTINRALQALPVTQHAEKLWKPLLLPHLLEQNVFPVESRARLLQRYVQLQPEFGVEYGAWCERHGQWGRAAVAYQTVLIDPKLAKGNDIDDSDDNDDSLWQAFGNLCVQRSAQVEAVGIQWEAMFRTALQQASVALLQDRQQQQKPKDQLLEMHDIDKGKGNKWRFLQGMLYNWLATAWVRRGAFELARSAYEEGLAAVTTVRDFSLLYEAYLQLEEGLLEHTVAALEEDANEDEEKEDDASQQDDDDWDILLQSTATSPLADMELAVARAEHLTKRRPLLLNAVLLRQDPNNISDWLQRGKLYVEQEQPGQAASTLEEALQTVHPGRTGRSELVADLVDVYAQELQDMERARDLLRRVCVEQNRAIFMTHADDLATCWATWIELELRQEHWDEALCLARQAVAPNSSSKARKAAKFRTPNLTKNLRLWDLLLDLEESLGTVQTTKDAYNRALETKAATVQHVLNYTAFLKEHKYFEESFTVYERGIELFAFPHAGAKLLWKAYLKDFLERYQENQVERTRDLFHRCLEACPAEDCAEFYTLNGNFEEQHGLTKRALSVYRQMCQNVPPQDKLTAYQLYILKTQKYLGLTATRSIYQEAIETLEDQASAKMCMEFAQMEASLQQLDRARAVLTYGAEMADPKRLPEYWKAWNDFEIANGNEETFREMLRVKRSVEAAFSTVNYNATGMNEQAEKLSQEEAIRMIASQEGVEVNEASKTAVAGFVSSKRSAKDANLDDVEQRVAKLRRATGQDDDGAQDGDEIDLDDIDAEIEEAAAEGAAAAVQDVSTKSVPSSVFGGLAEHS